MIFLFIIIPLLLASLLPLLGKISKRFLPDLLASATMLFLLVFSVIYAKPLIANGGIIQQAFWFNYPLNIRLLLDGFSLFMLFTISLVSFAVTLYSINYMEHYGAKANYYALLLLMIAGMNGLVLSSDLFNIYMFLEVAAVASYALVAFGLGHDELEASFKYLMLSAVASAFILLSIAILFGLTGGLSFSAVAAGLKTLDTKYAVGFCSALFLMGFGLKAAIVPFHSWLPDAHPSAPAPISAMLSGVLIKVSGVYAMMRIFLNVFGLTPALTTVLSVLGIASIFVGALAALGQNDIKRMLAYSSISQIGYVVLGFAIGTPLGVLGGLFHLFNHALFKSLLFLNAGAVEQSTGTRSLDKMGGLAKRMPLTAATSAIGSLSIAGVPPLNGFWSKLLIIIALVQAKMFVLAVLAVLGSVVTLWYYLVLQRNAFFGKLNETWKAVKEAPFWMSTATVLLALLCIVIGLAFPLIIKSWLQPAADALSGGVSVSLNFLRF
ncbi:MAG: NADH-quinone oxidoreductase subunit M [Candidatus Aminicenantes bacterium]|nr:NADH-quinone oxidoreductase subunit M [Candidatus Aminicenantes bacterium]